MRRFPYLVVALFASALNLSAQSSRKTPSSKIYIADVQGDAQIDNGKEIDDINKKSVYNAEGTVIETKAKSNVSAVLSNGTGIYFDVQTRVQIRRFEQESFRPNRTDVDDEPSVSTTHVILDYGDIGISTSKLVAGSTMVYDTPLMSVSIRGRQSVLQADDGISVLSMLEGDATGQAGPTDAPHVIKAGQQMIVKPNKAPGKPNIVIVQDIPPGEFEDALRWVAERVLAADSARKLVYFEVQARKGADGSISVFDGTSTTGTTNEIVAIPVVPLSPPVAPVVSAANLNGF
jgi:hypothetical protein